MASQAQASKLSRLLTLLNEHPTIDSYNFVSHITSLHHPGDCAGDLIRIPQTTDRDLYVIVSMSRLNQSAIKDILCASSSFRPGSMVVS